MSANARTTASEDQYSTGKLVRRLFALDWQFRANCLWSFLLSLVLLLLGIAGLKFLGVVIDVIRHALVITEARPACPVDIPSTLLDLKFEIVVCMAQSKV